LTKTGWQKANGDRLNRTAPHYAKLFFDDYKLYMAKVNRKLVKIKIRTLNNFIKCKVFAKFAL